MAQAGNVDPTLQPLVPTPCKWNIIDNCHKPFKYARAEELKAIPKYREYRAESPRHISNLAAAMLNGDWVEGTGAIVLAKCKHLDGMLVRVNGNNRILARLSIGERCTFALRVQIVTYEVNSDTELVDLAAAYDGIRIGLTRTELGRQRVQVVLSETQRSAVENEKVYSVLESGFRAWSRRTFSNVDAPSVAVIADMIAQPAYARWRAPLITCIGEGLKNKKYWKAIGWRAMHTAMVEAFSTDHVEATEFFMRMITEDYSYGPNDPAKRCNHALIGIWQNISRSEKPGKPVYVYNLIIDAFCAHLSGISINRPIKRSSSERWATASRST